MTDYIVSSGVTSSGITLSNFDTMSVLAGGSAISTIVDGSYLTAYSGGTTIDTTVNAGGYEYVSGTVNDTTLNSGGTEYVVGGASAISTTVSAGGVQSVYGTASATTVDVSGLQNVGVVGTTFSTTINNGGVANVSGITDGTTLSNGAAEAVMSGGTASGTILDNGAQLILTPGASAVGTIQSGGLVTSSGVALAGGESGTTFYGSAASGLVVGGGQELFVLPGGSTSAVTVNLGAVYVDSGTTTGTHVSGSEATPAYEYVSRGGTVSGTFLYSGGNAFIGVGATAIDTMVSGGYQSVSGVAIGTSVSGGGVLFAEIGSVSNTIVSQGELLVYDGTAVSTILNDGPPSTASGVGGFGGYDGVDVYGDGQVSGTTVNGGLLGVGEQYSEGFAFSTTVNSGGYEVISGYGYATDTLLKPGGAIDVTSLSYASGGTVTLNSSDMLTVSMGGQTYSQQLSGSYTGEYFHLSDATSLDLLSIKGTLITLSDTPCYCGGTRILTGSGAPAVEELSIGDKVVTKSGALRAIRWIGRRSYSGQYAASHPEVLPVLIKQGALADEVPRRDLWVSPLHAMFLEGMLVPAAALVNGISIVRAEAVEQLDYFHLELDTHDVIYAEGALAESFIDDDSRSMFHNAAQYQRLYPQAVHEPARYCAPRVEEGEQLEALRARLIERTRPPGSRAQTGQLLGYLDTVSRERIEGWAQDEAAPDEPVSLRVLDHGIVIGQVLADSYREDLHQAGIGDGRHAFSFIVPGGLSPLLPHAIQVQRLSDGRPLQPGRATA